MAPEWWFTSTRAATPSTRRWCATWRTSSTISTGVIQVELVTHGPGIGLCLPGSASAEAVQALMARGVAVAACENTLRSQDMDRGRLAEGVVTVPSGIGELVRKQHQGWAYLRP